MRVIEMSTRNSYGLSKTFINSLAKINGAEDYSKIDARLKKLCNPSKKPLKLKLRQDHESSSSKLLYYN